MEGGVSSFRCFGFRSEDEQSGVVFPEDFSGRFLVKAHDDRGFVIFDEFFEVGNGDFSSEGNFRGIEFSKHHD